MMAATRVVVFCALHILASASVHAQENVSRDPFDVAWQLSFDGLEAAGCLPENFKHPDLSPCVEEGSAGGPALYQALACVADRSGISTSSELQATRMVEMFYNMSSEGSWITSQRRNVDICKDMMNVTVLTTPKQQGIFMLSCVRRLQNHQCRLNMMQQLGTKVRAEEAVQTGQALALMLDGGCVDSVKNSEDERAFMRCSSGTALDLNKIIDGVNWARSYTNLLVDASSTGSEAAPPSEAEVATAKEQIALLNSAILCTMRAAGAIRADGSVNYPRVLQSVSESSGRPEMKQVKAAEIKECQKQESNSGEEFLQCFAVTAPYACSSIYAHALVLLKGHSPTDMAEKPEASTADVASKLSFDALEVAGCLPKDFSAPDLGPCVKEGSKGFPALYQAMGCLADRLKIANCSGVDVNAMYNMINSMSSDNAWTSRQKQNVDICKAAINDTILSTPQQQGIFMLSCTRRLQKHQCRLNVIKQVGKLINVDGIEEWGQVLVRWLEGSCIDSVKNAEEDAAFATCASGTALNLGVIGSAIGLAETSTRVVEDGVSTIDKLPLPSEAETLSLVEQLKLFQSAISCMARATGEVKADGTVDYRRAQQLVSESGGRPELKKLEGAVVEACRQRGITDGEAYLMCHYASAAYACNSYKSYLFALS